jgi:hypothetical protein
MKCSSNKKQAGRKTRLIIFAAAAICITLLAGVNARAANGFFQSLKGGKTFYVAGMYKEKYYLFEFMDGKDEPQALYILDKNGALNQKITDKKKLDETGPLVFAAADDKWNMKKRTNIKICEMNRMNIERQIEVYYADKGEYPKDDLSNAQNDPLYFSGGIPKCPIDNTPYTLDPKTHRVAGHITGEGTHSLPLPELPDLRGIEGKTLSSFLEQTSGMLLRADESRLIGLPMTVVAFGDETTLFVFDRNGAFVKRVTGDEATVLAEKVMPNATSRLETVRLISCLDALTTLRLSLVHAAGESKYYQYIDDKAVCSQLTRKPGCGAADIEARIGRFCLSSGGGPWKYDTGLALADGYYAIKAASKTKTRCPICMTPNGVFPQNLSQCPKEVTCEVQ